MVEPATLAEAALAVLTTPLPADKVRLTGEAAAAWRARRVTAIGQAALPDRPARPASPELRPPREMPKRRKAGSLAGRIALLHALAHIELNAIDLAWDLLARFAAEAMPQRFFDDWVGVAADEARHFALLDRRLTDLGAHYGALPAHDGLWEASQATAHDLAARLAVVPMVLEARGLDVTPAMILSLHRAGDEVSAGLLQIIHDDEIGHVAAGCRWFTHLCACRGLEPAATWQALVRQNFKGLVKPPFNRQSRTAAGFAEPWYLALADEAAEPV
ncbi:MAG: DUF455 family protein [Azospirillum sp.]|nr:DUF455 family protein [Azospirillum sp.]